MLWTARTDNPFSIKIAEPLVAPVTSTVDVSLKPLLTVATVVAAALVELALSPPSMNSESLLCT